MRQRHEDHAVWPTSDNRALRIYSTTEAVAWRNTAYNQRPHPGFALAR